ncbi:5-formyltetrahydrofolate cyclo-ligase family protein [Thermomonospora echinospora]|uniref:5-formyltetrahydrofolate cyclo-ligase family protein n=1 Tax=Thermomonospora echinospora TaxID=1992 RepID=A0A1H6E375_9ACTN|nr:5-formyltetrahydrofolate cyclo-ligase [Thermomonospora echinospora]SEG92148.1 5-formyltetrahydrofolate cyclo-ligase family protein [Thermomonospora echinospora]
MQVADSKSDLRRRLLSARASMDARERAAAGRALRDTLLGLPELEMAASVAAYVSFGAEPETRSLLFALWKRGTYVLLPRLLPDGDLDWASYEGPDSLAPAPRFGSGPAGPGLRTPGAGTPESPGAGTQAEPGFPGASDTETHITPGPGLQPTPQEASEARPPGGSGAIGMLEPTEPPRGPDAIRAADVVLVPALAVDGTGLRLGRGGGSYDRALARVGSGILTVGLVYDHELVDTVPAEPHDQRLRAVVTPSRGLVRFA